jgi:hypothetical protein
VQADDVAANAVNGSDVVDNSLTTADIKNGEVSTLDTRKTIPSGATVTALLAGQEDDSTDAQAAELEIFVDHGLCAPVNLTSDDVSFDNAGSSAAAAAPSEESAACTGSVLSPTAPGGKVCIYLDQEAVNNDTAFGLRLGDLTTDLDRYGFEVSANGFHFAQLRGTWAYRAP